MEEEPDQYSVAVDDILDNLEDFEDYEENDFDRVDMIKKEIKELQTENQKHQAEDALLTQLHGSCVTKLREKKQNVSDISPDNFNGRLDADFR